MAIGLLWALRICEIAFGFQMNYVFADIAHKPSLNCAWFSVLIARSSLLPKIPCAGTWFPLSQFPHPSFPTLSLWVPQQFAFRAAVAFTVRNQRCRGSKIRALVTLGSWLFVATPPSSSLKPWGSGSLTHFSVNGGDAGKGSVGSKAS